MDTSQCPGFGASSATSKAVTNVRLLVEQQLRLDRWERERALAKKARSRARYRDHLPDAILHGDTDTAIEVELTLKSRKRVEQIILDLGIASDQVWYFAPPRLLPHLRERAAELPHANLTIHRYPPLAAEVAAASLYADVSPASRIASSNWPVE
ncbi:MAG TPA: hypothetical protein VFB42_02060 [Gaiellaceae bacterium]|nr:hypothetical protein [Gaiellaceae bacterium]